MQKYKQLWEKTKKIIFNPDEGWADIFAEPQEMRWHMQNYVLPAMGVLAIAILAGYTFCAITIGNYSFIYCLFKAIEVVVASFFSLYVSSLLVYEISIRKIAQIDYDKLFILMLYSLAFFWVATAIAGILANYPTLGSFFMFLGIYGMYPFYRGAKMAAIADPLTIMKIMLLAFACIVITYLAIHWSFSFILKPLHYSHALQQ